jgi:hypothetical protein
MRVRPPYSRLSQRFNGFPNQLKAPALFYTATIAIMAAHAISMKPRGEGGWAPNWMSTAGALMFCLSDTVLAFDKFGDAIPNAT